MFVLYWAAPVPCGLPWMDSTTAWDVHLALGTKNLSPSSNTFSLVLVPSVVVYGSKNIEGGLWHCATAQDAVGSTPSHGGCVFILNLARATSMSVLQLQLTTSACYLPPTRAIGPLIHSFIQSVESLPIPPIGELTQSFFSGSVHRLDFAPNCFEGEADRLRQTTIPAHLWCIPWLGTKSLLIKNLTQ